MGFEPTVRLPVHLISSQAPSTSSASSPRADLTDFPPGAKRRGAASDSALECVREVIVGQEFPLPDPGTEQSFQVPMRLRL